MTPHWCKVSSVCIMHSVSRRRICCSKGLLVSVSGQSNHPPRMPAVLCITADALGSSSSAKGTLSRVMPQSSSFCSTGPDFRLSRSADNHLPCLFSLTSYGACLSCRVGLMNNKPVIVICNACSDDSVSTTLLSLYMLTWTDALFQAGS